MRRVSLLLFKNIRLIQCQKLMNFQSSWYIFIYFVQIRVQSPNYTRKNYVELEDIIQNYAEDHANMKITKIQSNLMIIVQSFYKRNLISKDHCGIFQQKINMNKIENLEDILKQ
ncbi:Hypothetical_protein [Hexamita inflata]|uniref:Hypothetical_protein n=1 Tax=Hexamita inflata TaxID=28002 RepID=A0AA86UIH8_9EUKA|nr:Hypothetical protein HINF_LOCUS40187 [Hexamita inflata]